MKSIGSIFIVLMLIVVVFYGMQIIGNQSLSNSNLDSESHAVILNFSYQIDNNLDYNNNFSETSPTVSGNGSLDTGDTFALEFLSSQSESAKKKGVIEKISLIPDIVILSLGVPQQSVSWVRGIILLILGTFISFALYRMVFGGGKITDN